MSCIGNSVPSEVHFKAVFWSHRNIKLLLAYLLLGLTQLNDLHRRSLQANVFGILRAALVVHHVTQL